MAKKVSVREFMSAPVITGKKEESIQSVANKMKDHHVGIIVVVNAKGSIDGVISERDILNKVVALGRDVKTTSVREIMQTKVITGTPSMTDVEAAAMFMKHKVKKLPIVERNKLVGIITQTDILKLYALKWAL
ncbi:CBS domain-containing protein [Candidatus Woesearchaeota archaeon]|nr:MAG: CBS domain-containing protein [Candidatus Woesearchaeota archaeon]